MQYSINKNEHNSNSTSDLQTIISPNKRKYSYAGKVNRPQSSMNDKRTCNVALSPSIT
jgi:hypothetical protein